MLILLKVREAESAVSDLRIVSKPRRYIQPLQPCQRPARMLQAEAPAQASGLLRTRLHLDPTHGGSAADQTGGPRKAGRP